jgi:hypothetical protein
MRFFGKCVIVATALNGVLISVLHQLGNIPFNADLNTYLNLLHANNQYVPYVSWFLIMGATEVALCIASGAFIVGHYIEKKYGTFP